MILDEPIKEIRTLKNYINGEWVNAKTDEIWDVINEHHTNMYKNGCFEFKRTRQNVEWMHEIITYTLESRFYNHPDIRKSIKDRENKVKTGGLPAITAAKQLLERLK